MNLRHMRLSILFISLTFFDSCVSSSSTCPPESIMPECKCRQTRDLDSLPDIICDGNEVNFERVIQSLNHHSDGKVLHFGSLFWENGAKVELGDYFWGNITFRHLQIGTPLHYVFVSHVSGKAFYGPIADQVRSLSIRSFELGDDVSLFEAVSILPNLEYLAIEGRYLTHVPEDAFNCDLKEQCNSKLRKINFTEGTYETMIFLTRIEDRAFYNLPHLEEINMSNQDVMFVGDYAFSSPAAVESKLKIDLSRQWSREFTAESFSNNSLSELNRPVEIDLWGNGYITYVPESIFRPFFEANDENKIRLGMKMNCTCDMFWLYTNPEKYQKHFIEWIYFDSLTDTRVRQIHCAEEEELWQMEPEKFSHCQSPPTLSADIKDEL